MGQMDRSGTEDLGITARLMYGYLLSNTAVLTPIETSYVLLAGLIPQDVSNPTRYEVATKTTKSTNIRRQINVYLFES